MDTSGLSATAFTSTSDSSLNIDIEDATTSDCYHLLDNVNAKTFKRIDLNIGLSEVGFIAQGIQANTPSKFQNLVKTVYDNDDNPILALDYPKITIVLWNIIKDLKARIEATDGAGV